MSEILKVLNRIELKSEVVEFSVASDARDMNTNMEKQIEKVNNSIKELKAFSTKGKDMLKKVTVAAKELGIPVNEISEYRKLEESIKKIDKF